MTRIVQIQNGTERRVALVEEPHLRLLGSGSTVYALVQEAVEAGAKLTDLIRDRVTEETLSYDAVYSGESPWRLLQPIDHPEPGRCLVSGTGLTHLGSAKNRDKMHETKEAELTDSMKMFRWGLEGGRPEAGQIGTAPEWFFKGTGGILRSHGEPLEIPSYGEDGGEEAEIVGVYFIGPRGEPYRVGMSVGNEFADHIFERRNYLNLAGSKIRTCSIGPELVLDPQFEAVPGEVALERGGEVFWSKAIATGETEMCHSLRNIEHHHFKFETHRRPGDLHVHYFGAHSLSFGDGIVLKDGDVMRIQFDGFGRALRNPLRVVASSATPISVLPLG